MEIELFEEFRKDTGKGVFNSDYEDMINWLSNKLKDARSDLIKLRQNLNNNCNCKRKCEHCNKLVGNCEKFCSDECRCEYYY